MQYAYAEGLVKEGSAMANELDELEKGCNEQLNAPGGGIWST
jgi:carboxypeptidase D